MNLLRLSLRLSLACPLLQLSCCPPCAPVSVPPVQIVAAAPPTTVSGHPAAGTESTPVPVALPTNERTIVAIHIVLERAALAELEIVCLPAHPDVVAGQAAIAALQAREAELTAAGEPLDAAVAQSEIARNAVDTRTRLAELETLAGPGYPEIRQLRARLQVLDDAAAAFASPAATNAAGTED
jgi:hypothetical protein